MTPLNDRMPPLRLEEMDDIQKAAATELIAGPRKGVKGPFIPLLRTPELMARLQKVGEYLRFESTLCPRIKEFATLVIARQWTQHFEWETHGPLALRLGTQQVTLDALAEGSRPISMSEEETLVFDFIHELTSNRGVCDDTYRKAIEALGERGVIDLVGIIGYFTMISMVLNVAHTPAESSSEIPALDPLPK